MSATPSLWYYLPCARHEPAFNMALDEALLRAAPALGRPVLRFYGWSAPAATFGFFQKLADLERATPLRPLIRRPTGGGLVPHEADWTYSLAVPPSEAWYHLRAAQSYQRIHQWIQGALQRLGIATELAPQRREELPGQCFAGYEQFDLLRHGRKIAGAAQRRTREGLLIQGSLQPPPRGLARGDWENAMLAHAAEQWHVRWEELTPPPPLLEEAHHLAATKYGCAAYNGRR
jgi:lipoate-protein ligase A